MNWRVYHRDPAYGRFGGDDPIVDIVTADTKLGAEALACDTNWMPTGAWAVPILDAEWRAGMNFAPPERPEGLPHASTCSRWSGGSCDRLTARRAS